ncbi:hypothetical protein, partial [Pseudomonas aeruginosa]|uniref:hypothetical protein n=1 Tax=Pseudomonas aeruginosa TaxID=287 RepID=UPI0024BE9882
VAVLAMIHLVAVYRLTGCPLVLGKITHCPEPLTRPPLSADEISVLKCMALMEEEDRATFIRVAQRIAEATVKRRS